MNRDKSQAERELKRIESWIERCIKQDSPNIYLSALNMLTYGLVADVAQKGGQEIKIKLFEKLLTDLDALEPRFLTKNVWIIVELALLTNHLQSVHYVSGDNIIISRNQAKEILDVLTSLEKFLMRQSNKISSLLFLTGIISGTIPSFYRMLFGPLPQIVENILSFVAIISFISFFLYLYKSSSRAIELQQQLENLKEFFRTSEHIGSNEGKGNVK
jgi:hypothetical protein